MVGGGVVCVWVVVVSWVWVRVVVVGLVFVVVVGSVVVVGALVVVSDVVARPWHWSGFSSRPFRLFAPLTRAFLTLWLTLLGRLLMSASRSSVLDAATRQLPTWTFAWISSILEVRTAASWAGIDGSGPLLPPQPRTPPAAAPGRGQALSAAVCSASRRY